MPAHEERGTVLEVGGGVAHIRIDRTAACDTCAIRDRCDGEHGAPVLRWPADGLAPGDSVVVKCRQASPLVLAGVVYGIPLAGIVLGAFAGALVSGDRGALAGSAAGATVGAGIAIAVARIGEHRGWWRATIERG